MKTSLATFASLSAGLLALPSATQAQIAEAAAALPAPPRLAVVIEATADSPAFATQRAERTLQNVAEVVRQLGGAVTGADTTALGVARLPDADRLTHYPPPPWAARYVLTLRVATASDVQPVATAVAAAGATAVRVADPGR